MVYFCGIPKNICMGTYNKKMETAILPLGLKTQG